MIWNVKAIAKALGYENYQYNKVRLFLKGAKSEGDKELAKKVIALIKKELAKLEKEIL